MNSYLCMLETFRFRPVVHEFEIIDYASF